jgi:hypothetical protein
MPGVLGCMLVSHVAYRSAKREGLMCPHHRHDRFRIQMFFANNFIPSAAVNKVIFDFGSVLLTSGNITADMARLSDHEVATWNPRAAERGRVHGGMVLYQVCYYRRISRVGTREPYHDLGKVCDW